MEGTTPASHSSRSQKFWDLGLCMNILRGLWNPLSWASNPLIKATQTRPWPAPGDFWGWESGGDRADQREAWRSGEKRQVPG